MTFFKQVISHRWQLVIRSWYQHTTYSTYLYKKVFNLVFFPLIIQILEKKKKKNNQVQHLFFCQTHMLAWWKHLLPSEAPTPQLEWFMSGSLMCRTRRRNITFDSGDRSGQDGAVCAAHVTLGNFHAEVPLLHTDAHIQRLQSHPLCGLFQTGESTCCRRLLFHNSRSKMTLRNLGGGKEKAQSGV